MQKEFVYDIAFSRNIGWVTEAEQNFLKSRRVAIVGMGGVGGTHLINLVRLGIEKFHIADLDQYELANFNRQYGANTKTLLLEKTNVMLERARDISPNVQITVFNKGVTESNINDFLANVDAFVDGIDFYELEMRAQLFASCRQKNITAFTAAPIGMGTSVLQFGPKGMSFQDYFGFKPQNHQENALRFALGLSPSLQQAHYLVDRSKFDIKSKMAPSLIMGCELAGGVLATELLKFFLKRGPRHLAPWSSHYDAYNQRLIKTRMHFGARNPIFKLKLHFLRSRLGKEVTKERDSSS